MRDRSCIVGAGAEDHICWAIGKGGRKEHVRTDELMVRMSEVAIATDRVSQRETTQAADDL